MPLWYYKSFLGSASLVGEGFPTKVAALVYPFSSRELGPKYSQTSSSNMEVLSAVHRLQRKKSSGCSRAVSAGAAHEQIRSHSRGC